MRPSFHKSSSHHKALSLERLITMCTHALACRRALKKGREVRIFHRRANSANDFTIINQPRARSLCQPFESARVERERQNTLSVQRGVYIHIWKREGEGGYIRTARCPAKSPSRAGVSSRFMPPRARALTSRYVCV